MVESQSSLLLQIPRFMALFLVTLHPSPTGTRKQTCRGELKPARTAPRVVLRQRGFERGDPAGLNAEERRNAGCELVWDWRKGWS